MAKTGPKGPTKYKKEYADQMVKWFEDAEPFYDVPCTVYNKDGTVAKEYMEQKPNPPPFISEFARSIDVSRETINTWAKEKGADDKLRKPEFSDAYKKCKEIYREFIIKNGLLGHYNGAFAIFTAKNTIGWRDKVEQEMTHKFPQKIQIEYVRPNKQKGE